MVKATEVEVKKKTSAVGGNCHHFIKADLLSFKKRPAAKELHTVERPAKRAKVESLSHVCRNLLILPDC